MKKRMIAYLAYIDRILSGELSPSVPFDINGNCKNASADSSKAYAALIERHLTQIAFFQHERLIHLIVTVLFAILTFAVLFVDIFAFSLGMSALLLLLLVLLVPYIMHYYRLENGVQKMYRQYDELQKRISATSDTK